MMWSKMLRSTIWMEDGPTRLVWITLLLLKDVDGKVLSSLPGLAHSARVELSECEEAIEKFLSPDKRSSTKTDDGRRIREVDGGWQILNHEKYRYSTEEKREFWRRQKADQRQRKEERDKAREAEYAKRMKPEMKKARLEGKQSGAQQAIREGLAASPAGSGKRPDDMGATLGPCPGARAEFERDGG